MKHHWTKINKKKKILKVSSLSFKMVQRCFNRIFCAKTYYYSVFNFKIKEFAEKNFVIMFTIKLMSSKFFKNIL